MWAEHKFTSLQTFMKHLNFQIILWSIYRTNPMHSHTSTKKIQRVNGGSELKASQHSWFKVREQSGAINHITSHISLNIFHVMYLKNHDRLYVVFSRCCNWKKELFYQLRTIMSFQTCMSFTRDVLNQTMDATDFSCMKTKPLMFLKVSSFLTKWVIYTTWGGINDDLFLGEPPSSTAQSGPKQKMPFLLLAFRNLTCQSRSSEKQECLSLFESSVSH